MVIWLSVIALGYSACLVVFVSEAKGEAEMNDTSTKNHSLAYPHLFIPETIALIECVIGIIANALVLAVIIHNPLGNLRRLSWTTISNLAFADLLTSVTSIPFCVSLDMNDVELMTANSVLYVGYSASFFLVLVLAIERYIALKYPYRVKTILTKKRLCLACLVAWIATIPMGAVSWYVGPHAMVAEILLFAVLEIVVVFLIVLKVLLIRKAKTLDSNLGASCSNRDQQSRDITTALVIVILVLIMTAFPYFVAKQFEVFYYHNYNLPHDKIVYYFPYYFFPVACLNFIVNPFIYAWRLPDYRAALLAFFKKASARELHGKPSTFKLVRKTRNVNETQV